MWSIKVYLFHSFIHRVIVRNELRLIAVINRYIHAPACHRFHWSSRKFAIVIAHKPEIPEKTDISPNHHRLFKNKNAARYIPVSYGIASARARIGTSSNKACCSYTTSCYADYTIFS